MRALPHHYRNISGEAGEVIKFIITGDGGGEWYLFHNGEHWIQVVEGVVEPVCELEVRGDKAWKIFTNDSINFGDSIKITGKQELGKPFFRMKAVMM
jgi:hypothetical protein